MSEYTPTEWKRGDLITSNKLNNIEFGVKTAHEELEEVRGLVSDNADRIAENATKAENAANLVVEKTTAIEAELEQRAQSAAAHIEAYQDTVEKVAQNISGVAEAKAAANLAQQKADVNETSISGLQTQLTDLTKEDGVIKQMIDAGTAPMISDDEYNNDQQARAAAYDLKYGTKSDIQTALSNAASAVETAELNSSKIQELTETVNTAKDELDAAKALIEGNATKIQANADACDAATAQINQNVTKINKLISDAEEHMTAYSEAVAQLNQNVNAIAAATNTANTAKTNADEAKADAASAESRASAAELAAGTARSDADTAAASAQEAQESAAQAATKADEAAASATLAQSQAATANTRAGDAEGAAEMASAQATAAAGSAATAAQEATTAKSQAQEANATAAEAKTKAESALEALTEAQLLATLKTLITSGLIKFKDGANATKMEHVVETLKNGQTLQARIWNEASGGGLQFVNPVANIISFIGVNNGDGDNDIWAQFYAKNRTSNVGTRMNFTNHGVYMTIGKANGSYDEGDLLVTKKDLADLTAIAAAGDNAEPLASDVALRARMKALEDQLNAVTKGDSIAIDLSSVSSETGIASADNATVSSEDGKKTINAVDYDLVFNGGSTVEGVNNITAKSIDVKSMSTQDARLNLAASGSITISGLETNGTLSKDVSNAAMSINTSDHVRITDSDLKAAVYNQIEVGLNPGARPKSVIIDGINFSGKCSNNAISIFDTADYCQVTIANCTFADTSNPLRISNRSNCHVDVKFLNCNFVSVEQNLAYTGVALLQNYSSASAAAADTDNLFAPEKVSISFQNCTYKGINMSAFKSKAASALCGSGTAEQLLYVFVDKKNAVEAYDANKYPKLSIDGTVIA